MAGVGGRMFNPPGSGIRFPCWDWECRDNCIRGSPGTPRLGSVGEGLAFPLGDWCLRLFR